MPYSMKRLGGGRVQVRGPGGVRAKSTTVKKAKRQMSLLRGVERGWHPTSRKPRGRK